MPSPTSRRSPTGSSGLRGGPPGVADREHLTAAACARSRDAWEGQRLLRESVGQRLRLLQADLEGERETGVAERVAGRGLEELAQRRGRARVNAASAAASIERSPRLAQHQRARPRAATRSTPSGPWKVTVRALKRPAK